MVLNFRVAEAAVALHHRTYQAPNMSTDVVDYQPLELCHTDVAFGLVAVAPNGTLAAMAQRFVVVPCFAVRYCLVHDEILTGALVVDSFGSAAMMVVATGWRVRLLWNDWILSLCVDSWLAALLRRHCNTFHWN